MSGAAQLFQTPRLQGKVKIAANLQVSGLQMTSAAAQAIFAGKNIRRGESFSWQIPL